MKLDKIKFAKVIAFIVDANRSGFDDDAIETLDRMIDVNVPEVKAKADCGDVDELLRCMITATDAGFIPAIKAYRVLTGAGLKESKEAVEKYRRFPAKDQFKEATLGDILKDY